MEQLMGPRLYNCCNCRKDVSLHGDVISKAFQVSVVGLHTDSEMSIMRTTSEVLGWKYERVYEASR
ncbi:hypothetical protein K2173_008335 [Erythroxylum novogranatense]|uniref:Yippee domain-containing protein n=1 Tax=Erythroxylum novogranatense TaxID=1862640 RepID=A0AAV8TIQ3_9ROSI|nr:hypothetical protein K2173_008335 [Erythroxylum novogranatense]